MDQAIVHHQSGDPLNFLSQPSVLNIAIEAICQTGGGHPFAHLNKR